MHHQRLLGEYFDLFVVGESRLKSCDFVSELTILLMQFNIHEILQHFLVES